MFYRVIIFIYFLLLYSWAHSQENKLILNKKITDFDSLLVVNRYDNGSLFPIDSLYLDPFFHNKVTWSLDSSQTEFYSMTTNLMSTISTSGINELKFRFEKHRLNGTQYEKVDEFEVISNQSYGHFRWVTLKDEMAIFTVNHVDVMELSISQLTSSVLRKFFKADE